MNNNTKKTLCTVDGCKSEIHSKGLCRKHYRLKNLQFCNIEGCSNVHYAQNYCSKHYRIHYRTERCKVSGCGDFVNTRGYCTKHYRRFMKYGDTSVVKSKKVIGICKHKGCKRNIDYGGYCSKHYQRLLKHGTTTAEPLNRIMEHDGKCSEKGCEGRYFAKNLCEAHYKRQYKKAYLQTESGREISRNSVIRRRTRKRKAPINDFDVKEWSKCLAYFNNSCAYCGKRERVLQREHVIPISRGGSNTKTNILPSCGSCNTEKGTRTMFEWYYASKNYSEERNKEILKYLRYKTYKRDIQMQLF